MYDTFDSASAALRELAVYIAYDRDAARKRGDRELVEMLQRRFDEAHALADQLHDQRPDAVEAPGWTLHEARALVDQLRHRLAAMVPTIEQRRAYRNPVEQRVRLNAMSTRVVAYLRVSTDRQAEGFGLDVQEAAVRIWAKKHRARIAYVVTDSGVSGAEMNRPGLAEALGHVQAGRADAIVVPRLDRLARDLMLQEWVRAEVLRAGAQLRSADPVEDVYLVDDPDNPTGTLVRQIMGAVAEYERSMIRLRMNAGKATKRAAGGYAGGQPPYGYRAHGHELVPNLDEQRELQRMKRWRREGKSFRQIADRLNDEGVPARHGRWHPPTVQRVIERQVRAAS